MPSAPRCDSDRVGAPVERRCAGDHRHQHPGPECQPIQQVDGPAVRSATAGRPRRSPVALSRANRWSEFAVRAACRSASPRARRAALNRCRSRVFAAGTERSSGCTGTRYAAAVGRCAVAVHRARAVSLPVSHGSPPAQALRLATMDTPVASEPCAAVAVRHCHAVTSVEIAPGARIRPFGHADHIVARSPSAEPVGRSDEVGRRAAGTGAGRSR